MPTNADIPALDVISADEFDSEASPLGSKGLGEFDNGFGGPSTANAVYHATAKRNRDLPITVENLVSRVRAAGSRNDLDYPDLHSQGSH